MFYHLGFLYPSNTKGKGNYLYHARTCNIYEYILFTYSVFQFKISFNSNNLSKSFVVSLNYYMKF